MNAVGATLGIMLVLLAMAAAGWYAIGTLQARSREAFQTMAARRGWALTISDEKLGRPAVLRLSARGGMGWQVEVRQRTSSRRGPRKSLEATEFHTDEKTCPEGMVAIGPPIPRAMMQAAGVLLGDLERLQSTALARFMGEDLARQVTALRPCPGPDNLSVFASSEDLVARLDLAAISEAIVAWHERIGRTQGLQTLILLGPDGLRIRLPAAVHRADRMEAFVDLCLAVAKRV
ncbi:MAG: hypothetical protein JJT81_14155 [Rubellimicrobium sp.]|nr:hypothetical protein [Rubellimicrobium sp.]